MFLHSSWVHLHTVASTVIYTKPLVLVKISALPDMAQEKGTGPVLALGQLHSFNSHTYVSSSSHRKEYDDPRAGRATAQPELELPAERRKDHSGRATELHKFSCPQHNSELQVPRLREHWWVTAAALSFSAGFGRAAMGNRPAHTVSHTHWRVAYTSSEIPQG